MDIAVRKEVLVQHVLQSIIQEIPVVDKGLRRLTRRRAIRIVVGLVAIVWFKTQSNVIRENGVVMHAQALVDAMVFCQNLNRILKLVSSV